MCLRSCFLPSSSSILMAKTASSSSSTTVSSQQSHHLSYSGNVSFSTNSRKKQVSFLVNSSNDNTTISLSSSPFLFSSRRCYGEAVSDDYMGTAFSHASSDNKDSNSNSNNQQQPPPPPEADFNTTCPFKCLGLDRTASKEQVRENFLQLAKVHHPDVGGETKKFRRVNAAYKQSVEMIQTGYAAKTANQNRRQSYQAPNERERNGEKTEGCASDEEDARARYRSKTGYYSAAGSSSSKKTSSSTSSSSTTNNYGGSTKKAENKYANPKRTANFSSASNYANAERQENTKRTADGSTYNYSSRSSYYNSFMAGGEEAFKSHEYENFRAAAGATKDPNAKAHNTSADWFREMYSGTNYKKTSSSSSGGGNNNNKQQQDGRNKNRNNSNFNHHHQSGVNYNKPNSSQDPFGSYSSFYKSNKDGYSNNFTGSAQSKYGDYREMRGHPETNGGHHDANMFYTNVHSGYYGPKARSRFDQVRDKEEEINNSEQQRKQQQQQSSGNSSSSEGKTSQKQRKNNSNSNEDPHPYYNKSHNTRKYNAFDGTDSTDSYKRGSAYSSSSTGQQQSGGGDSSRSNDTHQDSSSYHSRYEEYRRSQEETEREFGADEGWFEFRENFFRKNEGITSRDLYRFRFSQATSVKEIDEIYTQAMNENVFSGYDLGEPLFLALERYHLGTGLGDRHVRKCFETIDDWEKRTNRTAVALYYHVILKLYTNDKIMWMFPELDSSVATEVVWRVLQQMQDKEVQDDCVGRSWWELLRLACMRRDPNADPGSIPSSPGDSGYY